MKLTMGQIHDVVSALSSLEDPEIKLSGSTVLSMAININSLKGLATAYEQARARTLSNLVKASDPEAQKNNQEIEALFFDADLVLRETEKEVEIRLINIKDLDLGNNPKIRPVTVARMMPILSGVD